MLAPAAEARTLRSNAASKGFLPIVTPFHWEKWVEFLSEAGSLEEFVDVPKGIRYGWRIGVPDSYSLLSSFIPPNHKSALDHEDFLLDYINSEVREGRYTGPFSPSRLESIIGPFRTSPLGVIPKPGSSKFRLIQDHSFPRDDSLPSINSMIDSSLFQCDWGTFSDCWLIVASAPPGSQAAIFDVEAAHRRSPIAPEDQHLVCVMFTSDDVTRIYLDHCACFGSSSSNGLFGRPGDAISSIYIHKGVDKLLRWSDDFTFFRFPAVCFLFLNSLPLQLTPPPSQSPSSSGPWQYCYDDSLIFNVAHDLGWPWAPSKHIPFAFVFPYLGFEWDLSNKTVAIPPKKRTKYLARLDSWSAGSSVSLKECQSVIGCLQHCTLVLSDGRSHLPSFYRFCSSFKDPLNNFIRHRIPSACLADIVWWRSQLTADWCGTQISTPPDPLLNLIFVDTSTSFGISLVVDNHWLAWKLRDGWHNKDCDIGWAEMVTVDLSLCTVIHTSFQNCHLILHSDHQGVVKALKAGRSHNSSQNFILRHIISNFYMHNIWLSFKWVKSGDNISDKISHSLFPSTARLDRPPPLPHYLKPFIMLCYRTLIAFLPAFHPALCSITALSSRRLFCTTLG